MRRILTNTVILATVILAGISAQDPTKVISETNVTGFSTMCQSCLSFIASLPGFWEHYTPNVGIDAVTLCTALAEKMPSVGEPCVKLFAEYWPSVKNSTTLEICQTLYFC